MHIDRDEIVAAILLACLGSGCFIMLLALAAVPLAVAASLIMLVLHYCSALFL